MIRLLRFLVLLGLLFAPAVAAAQDGRVQRTERIAAELVPMSQWAAPGSTAIVAVRQDIEPGWHTYWRNPGDSGGATTLTWTVPAGIRAGRRPIRATGRRSGRCWRTPRARLAWRPGRRCRTAC